MWSRIRPRCATLLGKSIAVAFSNSRSPREYEFATDTLQARLAAHVFASTKLFADDTPLPVLDPGPVKPRGGRTQTGRLWVTARDDRPWAGPDPPAAIYFYSPDRKAERPAAHLKGFRGVLQVDGYAGFETLAAKGDIVLAACWAHASVHGRRCRALSSRP